MSYLSYSPTAPETRKGFKEGQRVEFTGMGTIKNLYAHDGCFQVQDEAGYHHYVYPASAKVAVKGADPANWPPQVGDVWKAGGVEYFARSHSDGRRVVLVAENGTIYLPSEFPSIAKRNPTLIRRRGL